MTEHERARQWRENMGLSRDRLSELVGFSASRISEIEAGISRTDGRPVSDGVMQRYRMACAAVALGIEFDWDTATVRPLQRVQITTIRSEQ
ncbi:MAG: helix-turn-helix transcriptional regulator [Pseudomonadota bacterium]